MSFDLGTVVQIGYDIMASKYYSLATGAVFFYDYLLTLADEVRYVWSGRKSWTFWLFVVNRYVPMTWQFWQFTVGFAPRSRITTEICEKTSFYGLVMLLVCTLLAQVVLTVRIYAATMKNVPITIGFAVITAAQCVFGICITILTAGEGVQPQLPILLDSYHICEFSQPKRYMEIAYTSLSLFFDLLAFSLIIFLTRRSKTSGLKVSNILGTIAEDATCYFAVISSAHFTLLMTLCFGRVAIQLLPGFGVLVYMPLMISRLMLSLREAADPTRAVWIIAARIPDDAVSLDALRFASPRDPKGEGAIPSDSFYEA